MATQRITNTTSADDALRIHREERKNLGKEEQTSSSLELNSERQSVDDCSDFSGFINAAMSPSGVLWRTWFERVGEHATIHVVNATAHLVIGAREIHSAALVAALREIAETSERASLVQDRSVGIIKQTCAMMAADARSAIALAEGKEIQ